MKTRSPTSLLVRSLSALVAIGVALGTAEAQTGYDGCPAGFSRAAAQIQVLPSLSLPGSCRLAQCKPYLPREAFAMKISPCAVLPQMPGLSQCADWWYQVKPANASANFCPAAIETGGSSGWIR